MAPLRRRPRRRSIAPTGTTPTCLLRARRGARPRARSRRSASTRQGAARWTTSCARCGRATAARAEHRSGPSPLPIRSTMSVRGWRRWRETPHSGMHSSRATCAAETYLISRTSLRSPGCACAPLAAGRASIGPIPLEQRGSRLRIAAPVAPGTPLYEAGVAEDDEIVAVGGRELTGPDVLEREIQKHTPGSHLALTVLPRGASEPRTVDVTLIETTMAGDCTRRVARRDAHA